MLELRVVARRLRRDGAGAVAPEYALLIATVAILALAGVVLAIEGMSGFYNGLSNLFSVAP